MLKLILISITIFSTNIYAEQMCTDLPKEAINSELRNNPDNSISILHPGILYDNLKYRVANTETSAKGYCKFLGKSLVAFIRSRTLPYEHYSTAKYNVTFSEDGEMTDTSIYKSKVALVKIKCK